MRLLAALALLLSADSALASRFELKPCRLPDVVVEARCGTWRVFENRAAGRGRKIPLRVVVIPSLERPAEPDPIVYFEGGPGGSAIDSAAALVAELGVALGRRDLLLVEARGTGLSHPLECPEPRGVAAVEARLDSFMSPDAARRCASVLSRKSDLSQYTTEATVDDVEEVRAALGYGKANLLGASYGTRAVLVYLRRHPESVRTVQLHSTLPTDARVPLHLARHTQAAFDRMAAACAADASCRAAFPDPRADLDSVLARLAPEPVRVPVRDGVGKERTMRLSRNGVVQTVRYLLYRPAGVSVLPLFLRRAASGDLSPLAQSAWDIASAMSAGSASGLYMAVTCSEDVAFVDRAEAERLAAGTFVGDLRVRQQLDACAVWPAAKIPAAFLEPVRSDIPALIVSGESDPTTPLEWAEQVARTLPRSRVLVVPGGSHVFYGLEGKECIDRLGAEMVIRGSAESLDLDACRRSIKPVPFATSLPE